MSVAIEFKNVSKKFKGSAYSAVDNVSLTIEHGEFITILGSSGCGKTTLLKMINRLYDPHKGSIEFFGEDISVTEPVQFRRKIGYVIQQVGLFPHMTIAGNIATVPKILKWPKEKIDARVWELLKLVGLEPSEFKNRYPSQLSGGQQQRVGLARALAVNPDVMLLDEPFGAIDAINRINLQDELLKIYNASKKTYLFVTHDINEAFKLGSRVLIMDKGKIQQFDTPKNIVRNPANDFVKSLINSAKVQEVFLED
ncbi:MULTISPECIES: ABC transporter ATP-binding protein [unclassified Clostridium]|uniref:ABC transporter ATP-binding protein n=1 Tax=unclassified Clostridium TaxID=2614128 RepID=UPI000297B773|nr:MULTISPECIES: ABC transporter ATP-binding protein [unclassified Clostridium]EKQ57492.1 MAG: ABC-type proline/glycine betaine transport system, ATPase component [Clostridium sp. Maddingley MBC34-26]